MARVTQKKPQAHPADIPGLEVKYIDDVAFLRVANAWHANVPLERITPYYNNPRENTRAVPGVRESIRAFGNLQPIVVISSSHPAYTSGQRGLFEIVVGHTRHLAHIELESEVIPVILSDHLTKEQVSAYRIADNALNALSSWDNEKLREELRLLEQAGADMGVLGFSDDQLKLFMDDWSSSLEPEHHDGMPQGSIVFRIEILREEDADAAGAMIKQALDSADIEYLFKQ